MARLFRTFLLLFLLFQSSPRAARADSIFRDDFRVFKPICQLFLVSVVAAVGFGVYSRYNEGVKLREKERIEIQDQEALRAKREKILKSVLGRFDGLTKAERMQIVDEWFKESLTQLAFVKRMAGEFSLSESLTASFLATTAEWLDAGKVDAEFKPTQLENAFGLFVNAVHYASVEAVLGEGEQEVRDGRDASYLLTLLLAFIEEGPEGSLSGTKKAIEGGFLRSKGQAIKGHIVAEARARIVAERKLKVADDDTVEIEETNKKTRL